MKLYTKEMGLYESHSAGRKPFSKKADKLSTEGIYGRIITVFLLIEQI